MRLLDEYGTRLDAEFDLEPSALGVDIVLHSRAGDNRAGKGLNTAYNPVLERLLGGLASIEATITEILVDSTVARLLPDTERRIVLEYPISLSQSTDVASLRVSITEGQRLVASKVIEGRGGNKHKRIRISVDLTSSACSLEDLPRVFNSVPSHQEVEAGETYIPAEPNPKVKPGEVFTFDPSKRERALAGHAATQNALAATLKERGFRPRRRKKKSQEPDFDLAWTESCTVVAEVKSLTGADPTQQLRLGLGQVLHYRRQLADLYGAAEAVLAVEYEPPKGWTAVCADAGVRLTWPPEWPGVPRAAEPT